jgi:CRP-like cAMP-binding protein
MASTQQSENLILAALPPADFELLRPNLRTVDLPLGFTLFKEGEIPERAYFLRSGVVASTVLLKSGQVVEVRIAGREGAVGAIAGSGQYPSFTSAVVRIRGVASSIDYPCLDIAVSQSVALRGALAKYTASQQAMADQSVACNAVHDVDARLARRLMRLCTMSGQTQFTVTQEVLAEMLGVRRNSVSMVAHTMLEANVIRYARGLVEIVDVDRLHRLSCECYDTVITYRKIVEGN